MGSNVLQLPSELRLNIFEMVLSESESTLQITVKQGLRRLKGVDHGYKATSSWSLAKDASLDTQLLRQKHRFAHDLVCKAFHNDLRDLCMSCRAYTFTVITHERMELTTRVLPTLSFSTP